MITAEQIEFVAGLDPDQDFRFRMENGQTTVVVETPRGTYQKHEDGGTFWVSSDGKSTQFWKTERVQLLDSLDGAW